MVSTTYEVLCSESTPYKVHLYNFIHVAPPRPSDITPLRSDAVAQMPRHYICISAFSRLNKKKRYVNNNMHKPIMRFFVFVHYICAQATVIT